MSNSRKVLGIVGAEAAKFTLKGEAAARAVIAEWLAKFDVVSSGHCHLGGIDIWAEEEAQAVGKFDPQLIFEPRVLRWAGPGGFEQRNTAIAAASHTLLNIVVDQLPGNYTGMRFKLCYHCEPRKDKTPHVKSGGCWTMWKAADFGKQNTRVIIEN
jgi:hypothetical protein